MTDVTNPGLEGLRNLDFSSNPNMFPFESGLNKNVRISKWICLYIALWPIYLYTVFTYIYIYGISKDSRIQHLVGICYPELCSNYAFNGCSLNLCTALWPLRDREVSGGGVRTLRRARVKRRRKWSNSPLIRDYQPPADPLTIP